MGITIPHLKAGIIHEKDFPIPFVGRAGGAGGELAAVAWSRRARHQQRQRFPREVDDEGLRLEGEAAGHRALVAGGLGQHGVGHFIGARR